MSQSIFFAWFRDKTNPSSGVAAAGPVTIATALTKLVRIDTRNFTRLMVDIVNGGVAFNAFQVRIEINPDQPVPLIFMNDATDFSTSDSIFLGSTLNDSTAAMSEATDMTNLGPNWSAILGFEVRAIATVELWASVGSGSSNVQVYWGAN